MEVLDIERFISEVEIRPAIWDYRSDLYSDREKRNQAWNELCFKFIPDFGEKDFEEKNAAVNRLQRKWKSFRDCFKREHTKRIRADSTTSARKPYKYYQKLSFLAKAGETEREMSPVVQESLDKSMDESPLRPKRQKINQEEETVQNLPEPPMATQSEVEEAEWNFALSLLPHLKEIPHEYKLDAQMEILMVLKKYKRYRRQP